VLLQAFQADAVGFSRLRQNSGEQNEAGVRQPLFPGFPVSGERIFFERLPAPGTVGIHILTSRYLGVRGVGLQGDASGGGALDPFVNVDHRTETFAGQEATDLLRPVSGATQKGEDSVMANLLLELGHEGLDVVTTVLAEKGQQLRARDHTGFRPFFFGADVNDGDARMNEFLSQGDVSNLEGGGLFFAAKGMAGCHQADGEGAEKRNNKSGLFHGGNLRR